MKSLFKVMLTFGILLIIGSVGLYQYYQSSLQPTKSGEAVVIEIPKGSSSKKIAALLEQHQIIKSSQAFVIYLKQKGKGSQLQAGKYQFTPGQTVDTVINKLVNGEVYVDSVEVTIPEGWTITQIAALLAEKGLVNQDEFVQEANKGSFSYSFIDHIPSTLPFRLEGYLFPKTYQFEKGVSAHAIIDRMLAQFQMEFNSIGDKQLHQQKMSIHELVTLASIVEREVSVEKERPTVAGVYYNRLKQNIMLQADATVQYALRKQKERLTYKDLEIDDVYNTYKHSGLPPGPIAAPGISSIEAVFKPEYHDFLFYVTKKDGSGEHYFSKTYSEHLKNIALSNRGEK